MTYMQVYRMRKEAGVSELVTPLVRKGVQFGYNAARKYMPNAAPQLVRKFIPKMGPQLAMKYLPDKGRGMVGMLGKERYLNYLNNLSKNPTNRNLLGTPFKNQTQLANAQTNLQRRVDFNKQYNQDYNKWLDSTAEMNPPQRANYAEWKRSAPRNSRIVYPQYDLFSRTEQPYDIDIRKAPIQKPYHDPNVIRLRPVNSLNYHYE